MHINDGIIPQSHPRAKSLYTRDMLVRGYRRGLVVPEGLIAHGRGEAYDYLIGEHTTKPARLAIRAAGSCAVAVKAPVISVNGNTAASVPKGSG